MGVNYIEKQMEKLLVEKQEKLEQEIWGVRNKLKKWLRLIFIKYCLDLFLIS